MCGRATLRPDASEGHESLGTRLDGEEFEEVRKFKYVDSTVSVGCKVQAEEVQARHRFSDGTK